ncbi:ankyrin repeat-containing protein At5g02620 isoform X2 [Cryptomeria japonica]|uniref:ankyrin repeat-containing protein At5g02620 isoform X2 n=1 Tax=Cryptomeria japonica TaxID=3369 RepID=UPI0027DA322D|nr:ankyrin repeat-containing protein At5g02620 isoform X2 [Cryptomeria japonica]
MAAERQQPNEGIDAATRLKIAVYKGDADKLKHILPDREELLNVKDQHGNTALHIAVGRNYVHIIRQLIEFQPDLCYCTNDDRETPICIAAKLGHLEALKELIESKPDAVKEPNNCGMNVLHLAAQVSQVRIVDYLNKAEKVDLSELVNQGLEKPQSINEADQKPEITTNYPTSMKEPLESGDTPLHEKPQSINEADQKPEITTNYPTSMKEPLESGDTPLHVAARTKNFHMVVSLLNIRGIDKEAFNKAGLTALDIVRENTEYHESYRMIALLANYPPKSKPFLYSAPKVSAKKYKKAIDMVNNTFDGRRNTELVVAVLLATMSFTAVFTIPGGFKTEIQKENGETDKMLGLPILIGIESFKLFLIFDCLAFFVSLFVVLVWQMSTPLTTGDKLVRFNFLRGVHPFLRDRLLEFVWLKLESIGALDCIRSCKIRYINWLYGYTLMEEGKVESQSTELVSGVRSGKEGNQSTGCLSMSSSKSMRSCKEGKIENL